MCGRFTLFSNPKEIAERFSIMNMFDLTPRYNIAPGQEILAVVCDRERNKAGYLRWGLVPSWANDPKIGYKMMNARGETVDEKPAFKRLLKRRRCLVIGDSFYEWKKSGDKKIPMRIKLKSGEPFAFAGLWDRWQQEDKVITSCTIITTAPNQLMKGIHDRMPVILPKEKEAIWLDRSIEDSDVLKSLLLPYDSEQMEAFEVSALVNSPHNDGESLIERIR
ncbi:SOS response-associated peptidase [Fictibacillus gelatini]|uniref:SOS response-associated peptidase n=1 Tax=Fictibacillus gelatini TaxID=225985 RepID=UPI00040F68DD|nr:SOS response-associated peptidase [Fictibacillus gelatini]